MSWSKHAFGDDNPSILRIFLVIFLTFVVLLTGYGVIFADFVPTDSWITKSKYLTAIATIITLAGVLWGRITGRIRPAIQFSRLQNAILIAIAPLLVFGTFWAVTTYAIPDILASVLADEESKTIAGEVFEAERKRRTWACRYFIEGEETKNAIFGRICSSNPISDESGAHGSIVLTVKKTAIGYSVIRVKEFRPT